MEQGLWETIKEDAVDIMVYVSISRLTSIVLGDVIMTDRTL